MATSAAVVVSAEPVALRRVTDKDADAWSRLQADPVIVRGGEWMAYVWSAYERTKTEPRAGVPELIVRSLSDEKEKRFAVGEPGQSAAGLAVSRSGRWIALNRSRKNTVSESVVLLDTATDVLQFFEHTCGFGFVGRDGDRLLLKGCPDELGSRYTLTLRDLNRGTEQHQSHVREVIVHEPTGRAAWSTGDSIVSVEPEVGTARLLYQRIGAECRNLSWSQDGNALAVLCADSPAASRLVVIQNPTAPLVREFVPERWPGFPPHFRLTERLSSDYKVNPGRLRNAIQWRSDGSGVFLNIVPSSIEPPLPADAVEPGVVLWHSQSGRLPAELEVDARNAPFVSVGFLSLGSGRFTRLTDEVVQDIQVDSVGDLVLGYAYRHYGWMNRLSPGRKGYQKRDYYLIDLNSGVRTPVITGVLAALLTNDSVNPQLTPDAAGIVFQDNEGEIALYDIARGTKRSISSRVPAKFYLKDNDPKRGYFPALRETGTDVVQGFSADGRFILVSDEYDVWALPLKGAAPVRLTPDGRRTGVAYEAIVQRHSSPASVGARSGGGVDLTSDLYFSTRNMRTGETGLAVRAGRSGTVTQLVSENAQMEYWWIPASDRVLLKRQTAVDVDFYLADAAGKPIRRLTDLHPQQRDFVWFPQPVFLSFRVADRRSQAALFLPVGASSGAVYPTIVHVYEIWGGVYHSYIEPRSDHFIYRWLRAGYAVLVPDINAQTNNAGRWAHQVVEAAVTAAEATGKIDAQRLGIFGFSHGAYETSFIITQSNRFKAAIAEAGISNLISAYGTIHLAGRPQALMMEKGQPYIAGPWWDNWEAFIGNSPLYGANHIRTPLLLLHGDKDPNVAFSQSLELFNTLRKMGKEAVLLQYKGAEHDPAEFSDGAVRELQFFNHLLKGEPAPLWWSEHKSYYDGQTPST